MDRTDRCEGGASPETLAAEVTALQSGEDWQRYLAFQARLHTYSPNNVMLITAQHAFAYGEGRVGAPEPTYVAGFNTWRALGRSVDKGQHGYAVLAPCRYERQIAVDPDGNARRLSAGEALAEGETIERRNVLGGFRIEHVFDVSQTSGGRSQSLCARSSSKVRLLKASGPPCWR